MELLNPAHPPHQDPNRDPISGLSFRRQVDRPGSTQLPEIAEEAGGGGAGEKDKVFVAVGKSVEKAVNLLRWTLRRFGGKDICLLHVHQPSPLIPTLLGKLPASQANGEVVSAYRREEKEELRKLLEHYSSFCGKLKVKTSIITFEADQVHKGIVELVNRHTIRNLVMGAIPENCMRIKKNSSKARYAARNAPCFCDIWFVNKGKLVWMREASEEPSSLPPVGQAKAAIAQMLRSNSLPHTKGDSLVHPDNIHSKSSRSIPFVGTTQLTETEPAHMDVSVSPTLSSFATKFSPPYYQSLSSPSCTNTGSECASSETRWSLDSYSKDEEESLYSRLREVSMEAEASRNGALAESLKCQELESEAMEAINKLKDFESARFREVKLRKEAEEALRTTLQEQEKLVNEKQEVTIELQKTMRNVALLNSHAQEANRRHDEVAGELKLIQASIATLRQEKQRIRQQKMEAVRWLERWRSHGQAGVTTCNGFIGLVEDFPELAEFSLADVQTATCNFSESFKIGKGGHGCVYKGEMLGRTVAIKKLYPHNMQGQSEFQQEAQLLSKLQHPHLVTLLGVCPEAWSLVYEYLPNGSLQGRLFRKTSVSPLTWKTRARIVAEISSALCFLHSTKPEKIVHGDLKPENILLDSELSCKICDFGISRLVTEDTLYCPSFRRSTEPKGAFPYSDPEFQRIGVLTPKSDIYAFGLIILQILTGRPPVGLVGEVRKAVSCGKLASILDTSAGEWPMFVARRLADLGLQCCELCGRDRPDLKPSLVRELGQLHVSVERPVPSFFLCPILQEIMHDPQVAADGFTYEGEALRDWLENGRESSPMTNLKLSHLNLTPNHAIRQAIQDWLCRA
ncbi:PREDICTED: U-box domain-containing protein 33 [Theobroma cacao]|uniref:RING-type E3 ubiquitin transferase n=1 Tax=Theobroma cacao TaxID=3641 RepID=A0AB32UT49_THECC|nr:PREDICTED: U-box domain-containing protein 33 [Theobroma cacao]